jgi:hypothetical protein
MSLTTSADQSLSHVSRFIPHSIASLNSPHDSVGRHQAPSGTIRHHQACAGSVVAVAASKIRQLTDVSA